MSTPWGWTPTQMRMLASVVMETLNPYQPRTGPMPDWKNKVLVDRRSQLWTFRGTPVRVDQAIEVPYLVWYPNPMVPSHDPENPADWLTTPETLLVGYVGAGGW